jgi:AraC-like DNA-binding protein
MYKPINDGIEKTKENIIYSESKPPSDLEELVVNFWELKTKKTLKEDFTLHVIPDGCVNILFNQHDTNIAAITARQTKYAALNLGKSFNYIGVQLIPGVWRGDPKTIANGLVDTSYNGELPLIKINQKLLGLDFGSQQLLLSNLIRTFKSQHLVVTNNTTLRILANLGIIHSVKDMANLAGLSPRQLQRVLKSATGFTPHNFLKVLKLQQSFCKHYLNSYFDQAHFIRSFKDCTGYTPGEYFKKFDIYMSK